MKALRTLAAFALVALMLLPGFVPPPKAAAQDGWWDTDWAYRNVLVLMNIITGLW